MTASNPHPSVPASGLRPTSGAAEAPAHVREYTLLRRIGSGAMGQVWLGRHRVTGGLSAVKILHPGVGAREGAARFFGRERRAISLLSHPHIVAVHHLGEGSIATADVAGADLSRRMQTPITPRMALRYALQIASALEHAHARGVVHRDVKPSNILVDRRGNAWLSDFGLAALSDDDASHERAGTPAFMAPEQMTGRAGPAADQFALARTLATVLAGLSGTAEEDPLELLAGVPRPLVDVLRRATASDPESRFPDMGAFARALESVELGDAGAIMRLAPESRVRAPFAWATRPRGVRAITHEIRCADYRLSDLERSGVLTREAVEAFRSATGYHELAWTMYAHEGRLGPVSSDGALARATDLVVILHGFLGTRVDWHEAAFAVCRDNAQAVVLVPDLFGMGESRYLPRERAESRVTYDGTVDAVLRWLDLLSVRDMPTVLVGHSYSGAALLAASDGRLGERVTRIAVTPGLAAPMPPGSVAFLKTMRQLARVPALRGALARVLRHAPDYAKLGDETCARFRAELLRAPTWVLIRSIDELLAGALAPAEALHRSAILVSEDDAFFPARLVFPYLVAHGIPPELIQRIGHCGHYPQLENLERPEARAHNVEQITRWIEAMLTASRDGVVRSTWMASTMIGDEATSAA